MKYKRNNKQLKILIIILLIVVGCISLAYSYLSTKLTITGGSNTTVTSTKITWDVHFKSGTITPTKYGTSATGRTCPNLTISGNTTTSVTIPAVVLSKPGDGCSYKLTVENTGTLDAVLAGVTFTKPKKDGSNAQCNMDGNAPFQSTMTCSTNTYNFKYVIGTDAECTTPVSTTSTLTLAKTSGTRDFYLCIYYPSTSTKVYSATAELTNAALTLNFVQNE